MKFNRVISTLLSINTFRISATRAMSTSTTKKPTSELTRIGLGMAALGRPGYINLDRNCDTNGVGSASIRSVEHMQELAEKVMQCVIDTANKDPNHSGPAWFDCARSYGKSEDFVGAFLQKSNISPGDVYISSKWGYEYVADWNVTLADGEPHEIKNHSVDMFLKQLQETKSSLGTNYVNLYQIHSATFESGVLTNTEVHDALFKTRDELGWKLGLSVSSPLQNKTLEEAMTIANEKGDKLFDSVQCTYNLLEQTPGEALLKAHEAGMDIIIKEGLANGRLLNHPILLQMCEHAKTLSAFSNLKDDLSSDQLALGAILAQPFRPRVLSGAVTSEQYKSNYKALEVAKILEEDHPELLEELMEKCKMESKDYWADRAALSWN